MNAVVELDQLLVDDEEDIRPGLFQVWIDLQFGDPPADWWWNSEPQSLKEALQEAAEERQRGWVCMELPEGQNPRPDGRWDNP